MRRVVLLSLLLAGTAFAKPKVDPTPAPAPVAATAPSAPTAKDLAKLEKAHADAFTEYDTQLQSGQKARAADALVALVNDPALIAFHAEAYGKLGDLFLSLDLPYAALTAFTRGFDASDETTAPAVGIYVPKAIQVAEKVGDINILEAPFSKNLALARTAPATQAQYLSLFSKA